MEKMPYSQLQLREIFHLEFLRWLGRKVKPDKCALKGGANLRFFFGSIRYSEDMDLDASGISVSVLRDIVMAILTAPSFQAALVSFGIEKVVPPDISKAKQTETTQRFKAHLLTAAGEDLFTKIEFSRRGFNGNPLVETVSGAVLHAYKLPPLVCLHYGAEDVMFQKISALAARTAVQARDVFDLYVLSTQIQAKITAKRPKSNLSLLERARENAFEISFEQFRDTVISYLEDEDRSLYNKAAVWDEIKLKVSNLLEAIEKGNA